MQPSVFNYKKIRSELYLRYQVDLDETSSSILFILQQEQRENFLKQNQHLEEATRKINAAKRSLQVDTQNPPLQAFWFGMGKWGMALMILIVFTSIFYTYHYGDKEPAGKPSELLQWYQAYYHVSQRESKKMVTDFLKKYPMPQH